jgi:hypothetical protein
MQTGMAPKPWPLRKAPNDPNRISFDPLLYSVVLRVSEKPLNTGSQIAEKTSHRNPRLFLCPHTLLVFEKTTYRRLGE